MCSQSCPPVTVRQPMSALKLFKCFSHTGCCLASYWSYQAYWLCSWWGLHTADKSLHRPTNTIITFFGSFIFYKHTSLVYLQRKLYLCLAICKKTRRFLKVVFFCCVCARLKSRISSRQRREDKSSSLLVNWKITPHPSSHPTTDTYPRWRGNGLCKELP